VTSEMRIDPKSGVPYYRQIIDQVLFAITSGRLKAGDQLPTVRQLAVDLAVNPNTVARAYRDLELLQFVTTQQGTGTFVAPTKGKVSDVERHRKLDQLCEELVAQSGRYGFTLDEIIQALDERRKERR